MSKGQDSQDRFRVLIIRVGSEVGGEGGGVLKSSLDLRKRSREEYFLPAAGFTVLLIEQSRGL